MRSQFLACLGLESIKLSRYSIFDLRSGGTKQQVTLVKFKKKPELGYFPRHIPSQ